MPAAIPPAPLNMYSYTLFNPETQICLDQKVIVDGLYARNMLQKMSDFEFKQLVAHQANAGHFNHQYIVQDESCLQKGFIHPAKNEYDNLGAKLTDDIKSVRTHAWKRPVVMLLL